MQLNFLKLVFILNILFFELIDRYPGYDVKQIAGPFIEAEGPYWSTELQRLFFVDIIGQRVYQYNPLAPEGFKLTFAEFDNTVSVVIPIKDSYNEYIIGKGLDVTKLIWYGENTTSPRTEVLQRVDQSKPDNRLNDGKADYNGRLWIGTMYNIPVDCGIECTKPNQGTVYRRTNDVSFKLEAAILNVSLSNGFAWSPDYKQMYYIDTPTRTVQGFNYELNTGAISNRRIVFDFAETNTTGDPDGMTVDNNGNLWVACWGGFQVINVDPKTGTVIRFIPIPARTVTSVAFGEDCYKTLYVTTSRRILSSEELKNQPDAGSVFRVTGLGVHGFYNNPVDYKKCNKNNINYK